MKQSKMNELIKPILETNKYDNRIIELNESDFSELVNDIGDYIIDGYFVLNREFRYPATNITIVNSDYKDLPDNIIYVVINNALVTK